MFGWHRHLRCEFCGAAAGRLMKVPDDLPRHATAYRNGYATHEFSGLAWALKSLCRLLLAARVSHRSRPHARLGSKRAELPEP
jgi:hypothetical protein